MINIRGKITSKLLEAPFIWIYGSKIKAELDLSKFQQDPLYASDEEKFRAFVNADFWEYLIGWGKGEPFNLSKFLTNIKDIDKRLLFIKITNHYQLELLRKKQYEKSSIGLKLLQCLWSKKSVNKQTVCDEFGISNETFVKWLDFIETHKSIQKSIEGVAEECKSYLSNLKELKSPYKYTLIEYMLLHMSLNKDNPVSTLSFSKNNLSHLINNGPSNLYKNLSCKIDNEELNFDIFPFTVFKQLAKNNGYENNDEMLKNDLEDIFSTKAN